MLLREPDPALHLHPADIFKRGIALAPLLFAGCDVPADFLYHPRQLAVAPALHFG
jgi:hypothetical protein